MGNGIFRIRALKSPITSIVRHCNDFDDDDWCCDGCELWEPETEQEMRLESADGKWREVYAAEQRPPSYTAEDYSLALRQFASISFTNYYLKRKDAVSQNALTGGERALKDKDRLMRRLAKERRTGSDTNLATGQELLTLNNFYNISELLKKLKTDLKFSYIEFVEEFVSANLDGVSLLLDVLKGIQLSQTDCRLDCRLGSRQQHLCLVRTLADEHETLMSLRYCLRASESGHRLASYTNGLYTLAVCLMSNVNKSRILASELLCAACWASSEGHAQVLEAISTLRLRFGEPIRFKFLIGMLNSFSSPTFQVACLRLLNAIVETTLTSKERAYLQAEMEEAGFEPAIIRKLLAPDHPEYESMKEELERWEQNYIDVGEILMKLEKLSQENSHLKERVYRVEELKQVAEKERNDLIKLEETLKRKCTDLEEKLVHVGRDKDRDRKLSNGSADSGEGSSRSSLGETRSPSGHSADSIYVEKDNLTEEVLTLRNDTILMDGFGTVIRSKTKESTNTSSSAATVLERSTNATRKKEEEDAPIVAKHIPKPPAKPRRNQKEILKIQNGEIKVQRAVKGRDFPIYEAGIYVNSVDFPVETSDTESAMSPTDQGCSSLRTTIETESTKSFGFVRPGMILKRSETFADPRHSGSHLDLRRPDQTQILPENYIRRSESFANGLQGPSAAPNGKGQGYWARIFSLSGDVEYDASYLVYDPLLHDQAQPGTQAGQQQKVRRGRSVSSSRSGRRESSVPRRQSQRRSGKETLDTPEDWTIKWRYPKIPVDQNTFVVKDKSKKVKGRGGFMQSYDGNFDCYSKANGVENGMSQVNAKLAAAHMPPAFMRRKLVQGDVDDIYRSFDIPTPDYSTMSNSWARNPHPNPKQRVFDLPAGLY